MRSGLLRRSTASLATLALTATLSATLSATVPGTAAAASGLPTYDHIVLAIFENHEQSQIIGAANAPYLTSLASQGASFTQSYAIEHPSQPNYLDLFSGGNQGVTDDSCPHTFASDSIGHQVIAAGKTFVGYSEGLPSAGSGTCLSGTYARKHAPWTNFSDLDQTTVNQPYTAFPTDFTQLPTYSWVVPDLCNDMHDCSVTTGDTWARDNLDAYAQWAKTHNSLLVVTFDEDDKKGGNQIATAFVGAHINVGTYSEHIDHYTVLRTIEDLYGLPALGGAASRTGITDAFSPSFALGTNVIAAGQRTKVIVTGTPGDTIHVVVKGAASSSYTDIATLHLNSAGGSSLIVTPSTTSSYGIRSSQGSSRTKTLLVKAVQSLALSVRGRTVTFAGHVAPSLVGRVVSVYYYVDGGRVTSAGSARTTSGGQFSVQRTFPAGLHINAFAQTDADSYNAAGRSPLRTATVGG